MSYNLRPRSIAAFFQNDEEEEVLDRDDSESSDNVSEDLEESDEYEVECESSDTDEMMECNWEKSSVRMALFGMRECHSVSQYEYYCESITVLELINFITFDYNRFL
ncbi:hypothetical protein RN001_016302 [Aquatica leii]|uniref:Uncharacterized protein n=1 Tax=Aquatica leii TaxID=1421715 RepID=A0AAN7QBE0_9COLE|nr:hypothetical protein RN001_016302 [Aquatica leii]